MSDENNIECFIEAQKNPWAGYEVALAEIENGRKISHWIWYCFTMLRRLGHTRHSHYYGISVRKETEAYLAHPILGSRLKGIVEATLKYIDKSALSILGNIDAQKYSRA